VAVSSGAYQVTDNGVVIADSTALTGVTKDIKINIDQTAGADNTVSLDLGGQTVDHVIANLGNGANSLTVSNGTAASLSYAGGSGADMVELDSAIT
jgi:hypothetical protein